jgi:hypothetical protein
MEMDMRTIAIASTALLLVAGSPAGAAMLLGENDNGHKQVVNTWSAQPAASARYGARIETRASGAFSIGTMGAPAAVTRGFLLGANDNDHKKVENGYAN